jgi:hypothetical protein
LSLSSPAPASPLAGDLSRRINDRANVLTSLPLLLMAFLGLLPYVSSIKLPPAPSFWAEWAATLIALGWMASLPPRRRGALASPVVNRVPVPAAVLGFALLVAVLVVQLLLHRPMLTGGPSLALLALVVAALLCITGARVLQAGESARLLDAWSFGVLVALALNFVDVLAERQGWHLYIYIWAPRPAPVRAEGFFGQPNQLAVFSAIAMLAAHYLWMRGRLPAVVHAACAFATGLLIAGSASRAGAIIWLAAIVASAWVLRGRVERQRGWALLAVGTALFVAAHIAWRLTGPESAAALPVIRNDTLGRIELWRDSWALVKLHPWAGVGYGNFLAARWNELSTSLFEPAANHAHNIVAQLAVELGVFGALATLLPIGWALWHGLNAISRRGVAPERFLSAAVALALAMYSLVEFPLWYMFFLLPFALMLGLIEQPSLKLALPPVSRDVRWLGYVAAVAVCGVLAFDYQRSESLYSELELQQREARTGGQRVSAVNIPMQRAASVSTLSAFDLYANLMYSRALNPDGLLMRYKLEFTQRAMLTMINEDTLARHVSMLVVAGDLDEARALMARSARSPVLERETRAVLGRFSTLHPDIVAFLKTLPPLPPAERGQ